MLIKKEKGEKAVALIKRSTPNFVNATVSSSLPKCAYCGKHFTPSRKASESNKSIGCICPSCENTHNSKNLKEL